MKKIQLIIYLIFIIIIVYSLFLQNNLKQEIYNIKNNQDKMSVYIQNNIKPTISRIEENSFKILDKQSDINASVYVDLDSSNINELHIKMKAVPKDINLNTDKIYFIFDIGDSEIKKQLKTNDGCTFTAEQNIPLCKDIRLFAVIESIDGKVKTEKLDYIDVFELLSYEAFFDYFINFDEISKLKIFFRDDQKQITNNFNDSKIAIYTKDGVKCAEYDLVYNTNDSIEDQNAVYDCSNISFDIKDDEVYEMFFESKTRNGIKYKCKIATVPESRSGGTSIMLIPLL